MTQDWKRRHEEALLHPHGPEAPIVEMVRGWRHYATTYAERYECPISTDYVLGPAWASIGGALRILLNGELGRLDGGSLDGLICDALRGAGFDPDTLERE